jgi:hypothetical protein
MGLQLLTGDKAEFGKGGVWRWKGGENTKVRGRERREGRWLVGGRRDGQLGLQRWR